MTFREATVYITSSLRDIYDEREAANITELVMEYLTGLRRIDRIMLPHQEIDREAERKLSACILQLQLHTPVQYILEEAWFYGMKLHVNKNVLIPRPETEELVNWIVEEYPKEAAPVIIDIGTGSGCIAIAVKKALPAATVYAVDISSEALKVAQKNADLQNADVIFRQADILDRSVYSQLPLFDTIVSNPPYIPEKEQADMSKNVTQYEPHLALFVPDDHPLRFYEAIGNLSSENLKPEGRIYLEIHETFGEATRTLYYNLGYSNIRTKKDMQHKDRMMCIQK